MTLTETDFCDHEQAREFSIEGFKTHVSPYGSNKKKKNKNGLQWQNSPKIHRKWLIL